MQWIGDPLAVGGEKFRIRLDIDGFDQNQVAALERSLIESCSNVI